MITDMTAIILAGGKSTRMHQNKALLTINGKTIIKLLIEKLDEIFSDIIIITNLPNKFTDLDKAKHPDIYPHLGPIAGIHSGLLHSNTDKNFIISCDLPLVPADSIRYLVKQDLNCDAKLFSERGKALMLCGIYRKQVCKIAEDLILNTDFTSKNSKEKITLRLRDLLKEISYETIDAEKLEWYCENHFLNMNTPEDYRKIKMIMANSQKRN